MSGRSAAARAWRSGSGNGSYPAIGAPNGSGRPLLGDERLRRPDDLERARLALLRRVAPGRDPVPAEDRPDRLGMRPADLGHVQAQLEPRPPPADPRDPVAEAAAGQLLAIGRGRERDPGIRVEVVDVVGLDQAVHRGVDRRRRPATPVEAEVERGDHLVLALDARVDVDQPAQPVQPQDGEARLGQRAEVAAGALDPQQLDRQPGHRVDAGALGRGVAPGVVGVPRVGARGGSSAREERPTAELASGATGLRLMRPNPPARHRHAPR